MVFFCHVICFHSWTSTVSNVWNTSLMWRQGNIAKACRCDLIFPHENSSLMWVWAPWTQGSLFQGQQRANEQTPENHHWVVEWQNSGLLLRVKKQSVNGKKQAMNKLDENVNDRQGCWKDKDAKKEITLSEVDKEHVKNCEDDSHHKKLSKCKKGNAGNRTQNLLFTRQTQYHYATPPGYILNSNFNDYDIVIKNFLSNHRSFARACFPVTSNGGAPHKWIDEGTLVRNSGTSDLWTTERPKALAPQTQQTFPAETLFHSQEAIRWRCMVWHGTQCCVKHKAWVKWLLCNESSPNRELFLNVPFCAIQTFGTTFPLQHLLIFQQHTGFDTHVTAPHTRGTGACGWHRLLLMTPPWHSLPHHPTIKPHSFFPLSTLTQHALAWGHSAIVSASLSLWRLCDCHAVNCFTDKSPQSCLWIVTQNQL